MIKGSFSISPVSLLICVGIIVSTTQAYRAQPPPANLYAYIETYSAQAIQQMADFKIPASVILAQAILESRSGTSELARRSNNHFGIKCHKEWIGDTVVKDDDLLNECFRKYLSIEESYDDHSQFLISRTRYAHLFNLPLTDFRGWCNGLKEAGYATHYAYAEDLISLIEGARLFELDGAEVLQAAPMVKYQAEIRTTIFAPASQFIAKDFAFSGYLWQDEKDILIQSLDMIIENKDEGYNFIVKK